MPWAIRDPMPVVTLKEYDIVIYSLGGAHNLFSLLVLITYFLSNHPTLPSFAGLKSKFRNICKSKKVEKEEEEEKVHESKLEVKFFSFTTLYYLIFLGLSVAGTVFQGYFFAFHLLNIVNNNQLLKGVIQAVTQNGRSLLWVAVLGFVVFYLYALISFALLRSSFDPESDMYCATLWQCTVTIIRYGLIGDIFENLVSHKAENTFFKFGFLVIYHLSFFIFITTIGLNIIFGIIVDTFSELRDLKWTAERDMRDTCFICSRNSYDFEHHGKGFDHHIAYEHHIWAYIFFFIHLHDTKQSDYTALELFVFRLLTQDKYDFFPLNRALSLTLMDEDSTESKVDDLLRYVMLLVDRQKEEDAKKKREGERQKQLRWLEEHRNAMSVPDSLDTGDSNGRINRVPSFGARNSQMFKQKRWQRGSKSYQAADSVDTQDSNTTAPGNKFRDSFHQDIYGPHDIPPPPPALMHQSTVDTLPLDSEPRSPPPRAHRVTPLDDLYPDPEELEPGFEDIPPPQESIPMDDSVHLIDFEDGERDEGDDDLYKLPRHLIRTPSPPGHLDRTTSTSPSTSVSIPRQPSLPPPPSDVDTLPGDVDSDVPSRRTPSIQGTLSRHSSHRSIPAASPKPPSVDFGVQVGESDVSSPTGSRGALDERRPPTSGSDPDRARPPSSASSDRRAPSRGRLTRAQTREADVDDDDPTIALGSDELRSTRV
ncbi:hypothetical protein LSH36_600g01086 [Paralvinella palmiformis]|uniref:Ion transport domain-containing protein n=1 Tax=Paralvinella palmiformis TaxID=53620 RepID=A0AAD9MXF7_9ANNE|nr:hypothetical protein LSH36_600g01086 [Paralvinella palmiformis]